MKSLRYPVCRIAADMKDTLRAVRRKAATQVYNRIMVTHLLMDAKNRNRVAGGIAWSALLRIRCH